MVCDTDIFQSDDKVFCRYKEFLCEGPKFAAKTNFVNHKKQSGS